MNPVYVSPTRAPVGLEMHFLSFGQVFSPFDFQRELFEYINNW